MKNTQKKNKLELKLEFMRISLIIILLGLTSCNGNSQEKQIFIPSNALSIEEETADLDKFCKLLVKPENLDRKTIYNLSSNRVIARRIQNDNLEYTQVRYSHMLLKLFSDAYFNCQEFTKIYYFVFDSGNSKDKMIVSQHLDFTSKLIKYAKKHKLISKLTNPKLAIFGSVEYLTGNLYTLAFYHYLPDNGPVVPTETNNRVALYEFELTKDGVTQIKSDIDKEGIQKILSSIKTSASPERN